MPLDQQNFPWPGAAFAYQQNTQRPKLLVILCICCKNASVRNRSQKESCYEAHKTHCSGGRDVQGGGRTSLLGIGSSAGWCASLAGWLLNLTDADVLSLDLALALQWLVELVARLGNITGRLKVECTLDIVKGRGGYSAKKKSAKRKCDVARYSLSEVAVEVKSTANSLQFREIVDLRELGVVGDLEIGVDGFQQGKGDVGEFRVRNNSESSANLG